MGFVEFYLDLFKSGRLERFSYRVYKATQKPAKIYTLPFIIVHIILYFIGLGLFLYIIGMVIYSPSPVSKTVGTPDYDSYMEHNKSVLYSPICVFDRPSLPLSDFANISIAELTLQINSLAENIWYTYFPQKIMPSPELIERCTPQICAAGCEDQKEKVNCTNQHHELYVDIEDVCMQLLFGNMGETSLAETCSTAVSYIVPLKGISITFHSLPSFENLHVIIKETTLSFSQTHIGSIPAITSSTVAVSSITSAADIDAAAKSYSGTPNPLTLLYETKKDRFTTTQKCVQIAGQINNIPLRVLGNTTLLEAISQIYANHVTKNLHELRMLFNQLEPIQCVFVSPPGFFNVVTEALSRALPIVGLYLGVVKFPLHFVENQIWNYLKKLA